MLATAMLVVTYSHMLAEVNMERTQWITAFHRLKMRQHIMLNHSGSQSLQQALAVPPNLLISAANLCFGLLLNFLEGRETIHLASISNVEKVRYKP